METPLERKPGVCFEVEKIIGVSCEGNIRSYRVQWAPAWVSGFQLTGCEHLVQEFLQEQQKSEGEVVTEMLDMDATVEGTSDEFHLNMNILNNDNVPNILESSDKEGAPEATQVAMNDNEELNDGSTGSNKFQHELDIRIKEEEEDEITFESSVSSTESDHGLRYAKTELSDDSLTDGNSSLQLSLTNHMKSTVMRDTCFKEASTSSPQISHNDMKSFTPSTSDFENMTETPGYTDHIEQTETHQWDLTSDMTRHINTHSGEKSFSCNQCAYSSSQKRYLTIHMHAHSREKPYSCTQCPYSCSDKSNLTKHLRKHTGEKPYSCSQCSYTCSQKSSLAKHLRTHSGEKPYSCSQCPYSCTQKSSLTAHLRTHTGEKPYSCDQCSHSFSNKSHLNRHMRTHSGEKPYSCDQCSHSCSNKSDLTVHMRTHTGEKPYSCSHCSYSCSKKSYLTKHLHTHR